MTVYQSTKDRFHAACAEARANGVTVTLNVMSCCRGCVTKDDLHITDDSQPVAWHFGGQGNHLRWTREGTPATEVYFNHNNGGGSILAAALRKHGFTVDWDGSDARAVTVQF